MTIEEQLEIAIKNRDDCLTGVYSDSNISHEAWIWGLGYADWATEVEII